MKAIKLINIGNLVTYSSGDNSMVSLKDMEIVISDNKIIDIGRQLGDADKVFDCENKLVTPGFVDCHTHPVFLDERENEFDMRTKGYTYEEIANKGGGINNSVNGVRSSSETELINRLTTRMNNFLKLGTTTIEAKSGYGLNLGTELKSLKVLHEVSIDHDIDIIPTFMGAHAIPLEYKSNPEGYVDLLCDIIIPEVSNQGIAIFNDVFCEKDYFSINESRQILDCGIKYGLKPRMHADEFVDSGAAELAGKRGALSADHLMAVSEQGIKALAENNVIATLLPGTTFFLGKNNYAPARKLIDAGITVALATDFNPGSSHIQSMPFIISLACLYLGLTVEEAFAAATYNAAQTLGLHNEIGSVELGKKADLIIWDLDSLIDIRYYISNHPIQKVLKNGEVVVGA